MSQVKQIRTITRTAKVSSQTHIRLDAFYQQQTDLWNECLNKCKDHHKETSKFQYAFDYFGILTEKRKTVY